MAVSTNRVPLSGLARKLVMDGLLEQEAAAEAFQESLKNKIPFVKQLVENKLVDAKSIAHAASSEFGVPLIDIDCIEIDPDTIKIVSRDLLQKHGALPLYKRGTRVFLGVADPTNLQALDEIKFNIGGGTTEAVVVEWDKLAKALDKALEESDTSLGDMDDGDLEDFDDVEVGTTEPDRDDDAEVDDAPVVRFVNKCLLDAIKKGASDLHFEPYEKMYRVRFRVDGVLQEVSRPPVGPVRKNCRAHQGHVAHGRIRATRAAGRTHQTQTVENKGYRFPRQHLSDVVW